MVGGKKKVAKTRKYMVLSNGYSYLNSFQHFILLFIIQTFRLSLDVIYPYSNIPHMTEAVKLASGIEYETLNTERCHVNNKTVRALLNISLAKTLLLVSIVTLLTIIAPSNYFEPFHVSLRIPWKFYHLANVRNHFNSFLSPWYSH